MLIIAYSYRVVKNKHFQSTLLGGREGGGHKNEYSVYAFDNVDNNWTTPYYGEEIN